MDKYVNVKITDKERKLIGCLVGMSDDLLNRSKEEQIKELEGLYSHSETSAIRNSYKTNETYLATIDVALVNLIPIFYGKLLGVSKEKALEILAKKAEDYRKNILESLKELQKKSEQEK